MSYKTALFVLVPVALLAACAETPAPAPPSPPPSQPDWSRGGPGRCKLGGPYRIDGVTYVPRMDWTYDRVGVASWYGPGFDKRTTANGDIYDEMGMTAAHPTLQLPAVVSVTNLTNGRSVVVRVNDRGPFTDGRMIDLSKRAARRLGFEKQGTARVRVKLMEGASRKLWKSCR